VITFAAPIVGGDYAAGGAASRALKATLVEAGVDAESIRRVMIAAYEAEMNVVIHAQRGTLTAVLRDDRVLVEVVDEGPGIADLELAMRPGYSTAPAQARAIGFGAGLGLPNIKRHVDDLGLESRAGRGTRLAFVVRLGAPAACSACRDTVSPGGGCPYEFVAGLGAASVARVGAIEPAPTGRDADIEGRKR
jgi:anti-sigma regulatory factor (Ser/Thr protein kinase)